MTDQFILSQLHQMPEAVKREVLDFIEFLLKKYQSTPHKPKPRRPVFGSAKGKYVLAPDFDEPLDDFKDYM